MPIFTPKRRISANNSGNVLFIILIAIMLFGALSFAVTRTTQSSSDGGASKERAKLIASEIIGYGNSMERAVSRVLSKGVSENQLDFSNNVWETRSGAPVASAAANPACTSDTCRIFNPAGGGMTAMTFDNGSFSSGYASAATKDGHARIMSTVITDIGSPLPDLILLVSYIPPAGCAAINTSLGIANDEGDTPPLDSFTGVTEFTGTIDGAGAIGDEATQFAGKAAGCVLFSNASANNTHYYQVLIAR